MKKLIVFIGMFYAICGMTWARIVTEGSTCIIDGESIISRLDINESEYETIVFRNSKFDETVLIRANESLKTIMIYNCDFADILAVRENPGLSSVAIANGNFKKHLMVSNNYVEGPAVFSDNVITGYFQLSENQMQERCSFALSRVESGISCFKNTFGSKFEINNTSFNGRSVLSGNMFNDVELNDVTFDILTFHENRIKKSIGFADCMINSHLAIRQLYDNGDAESKRSISFYNTSVLGSVYLDRIDETIILVDLWQLDFRQDLFIDNSRLFDSFRFIYQRVVHDSQSIENIAVINPYKEMSSENLQKFKQLLTNIKTGYDKRGERDAKMAFVKWEYHYESSFDTFYGRIIKQLVFILSFELFLNVKSAIIVSLLICIVFMFPYASTHDKTGNNTFRYLKIDNYKNTEHTSGKTRKIHCLFRYGIAILVSTSVFCNLPLATKKLREDNARNIVWVESFLGMIMLIIISAIVGRIIAI
jgi:hypothetical protein